MLYPDNIYYIPRADTPQPFFMKQTIGNACGTVALLHAICNNQDKVDFVKDSFLDIFYSKCKESSAIERADYLYEDVVVEQNHQQIAD
jgi:ubiquitin carboxyl-terminal hydrolase L3